MPGRIPDALVRQLRALAKQSGASCVLEAIQTRYCICFETLAVFYQGKEEKIKVE